MSIAVVGAPYPNKDGSNRAFEIKLCTRGDPLELNPEPRNRYDEHAIAVTSVRGIQIGYISSERAVMIGGWLRSGETVVAVFQEEAPWGAVPRIGLGGLPDLPPPSTFSARPSPLGEGVDRDPGFWPDDVPDDD